MINRSWGSAALCLVALLGVRFWAGAGAIGALVRPNLSEDAFCSLTLAPPRTNLTAAWSTWRRRQLAAMIDTPPGVPPVSVADNLYSETAAGHLSPAVAGALPRIYVPNRQSNDIYVIDPATYQVIDRFPVGREPQQSIATPQCDGINHADFSIDGRYAIFTCEFNGGLLKVDIANRQVLGYLKLSMGGMPQDIRVSPEGCVFFVADMHADGVFLIDGNKFRELGFIATGIGTHGLYPSREASKLYVANRGSRQVYGPRQGRGSVLVLDFEIYKMETETSVSANWPIPGDGSPDMGNVSADGKVLWLSGRFDNVVYAFDTTTGAMRSVPAGVEPHGLTVWPQPGRYSLGHTGNMR